jgi:AraC-like DNA-binding protein
MQPPGKNPVLYQRMLFHFNLYSGLLLPGVVQSFVYAALLLVRARRTGGISNVLAALILLVGALFVSQWMLGFAGWYDSHDWHTTLMFYLPWNHLLALGPLVWLYFRSLTNADFRWRRRRWLHFVPWVTAVLLPSLAIFGYDVFLLGVYDRPFTYFHGTRGPAQEWAQQCPWIHSARSVLSWSSLAYYLTLTVREYRSYRAYLDREFSHTAPLDLSGLRNVLLLFVVGSGTVFLLQAVTTWIIPATYVSQWPRFFAMSVLMYLAAIRCYATDEATLSVLRFEPAAEPPPPAADPPDDLAPIFGWVERRLQRHRDYLEPDLRLAELAARIDLPAALVSRAINTRAGMNFNDYVNGYRCRAFLEQLRDGRHRERTLLGLALDCGYNSKSTFNRSVRKQLGFSPKEIAERIDSGFDPSQIII